MKNISDKEWGILKNLCSLGGTVDEQYIRKVVLEIEYLQGRLRFQESTSDDLRTANDVYKTRISELQGVKNERDNLQFHLDNAKRRAEKLATDYEQLEQLNKDLVTQHEVSQAHAIEAARLNERLEADLRELRGLREDNNVVRSVVNRVLAEMKKGTFTREDVERLSEELREGRPKHSPDQVTQVVVVMQLKDGSIDVSYPVGPYQQMMLSQERGVDLQDPETGSILVPVFNGKRRACIKLWSGPMKNYDDFE